MLRLGTFYSDVRSTVLAGLSTATNSAIVATDSLLVALGKLQAQIPAAATLTTLGTIKANITQIARTTTPISVSLSGISVLGLTALVTTATVTVPGVQLGDAVQASFAGTPPTGLIPTAAQVTAANTVVVTFAATQAVTLAAGTQSLNFVWTR